MVLKEREEKTTLWISRRVRDRLRRDKIQREAEKGDPISWDDYLDGLVPNTDKKGGARTPRKRPAVTSNTSNGDVDI